MKHFIADLNERDVLGQGECKPREYKDLDDLIGTMNEEDVHTIEKSVASQREIDLVQ